MLSLLQLHRCSHSLKVGSSRLLVSNTSLQSRNIPRHIITTTRNGKCDAFKISDILKRNNIIARLCSTSQKPKTSKAVGYWLLGCSGMVFTAVVLGMVSGYLVLLYSIYYIIRLVVSTTNGSGVTRITESGLSMVTWKLLGEKLPRTEEEWESEFENYKQYPEYKYKNMNMTLSEFKWIWWMEYAHRSWGRAIGAAVFLPAAAFWATGRLGRNMKIRVGACCMLVAAQGLMGWYMVKSGLQDRFQGPSDVPRVSQYRLAAHLGLAFVLYVLLLGGALRVLRPPPRALPLPPAASAAPPLRPLVTCARVFKGMVFVTALSGAFVAGLDAGLVYSSFPKMGDRWLPDDIMSMTPPQRNLTENPTTVQFDHRVLGTTTVCLASALWLMARRRPLPPGARRAADAVGAMAWLQVTLGVSTLLLHVPAALAASHQAGSLALLSLAVWLTHELRLLRYLPK